jgi:hypothetical protein
VVLEKQAEDPCLHETDEDDAFEAQELAKAPSHFHEALKPVSELKDRVHARPDRDGFNNLHPKVSEFWGQTIEAEGSSCLSSFLNANAEYLYDWILEHKDPSYLGPIEARFAFFGLANSCQSMVVESAGGCGVLYEQE